MFTILQEVALFFKKAILLYIQRMVLGLLSANEPSQLMGLRKSTSASKLVMMPIAQ